MAFNDVETNFMYHHQFAKHLLKLIDYKGIINVGGPKKIIYNFAKETKKDVISETSKKLLVNNFLKNKQ